MQDSVVKERPDKHLGLAYKQAAWAARKYGGHAGEYVGTACIALIRACNYFNPQYGTQFSTYATRAIRSELQKEQGKLIGAKNVAKAGEPKVWIRTKPRTISDHDERVVERSTQDPEIGDRTEFWFDGLIRDEEREIVRMRLSGTPVHQIKQILGCSLDHVQDTMRKVRERVHDELKRNAWKAKMRRRRVTVSAA